MERHHDGIDEFTGDVPGVVPVVRVVVPGDGIGPVGEVAVDEDPVFRGTSAIGPLATQLEAHYIGTDEACGSCPVPCQRVGPAAAPAVQGSV